MTPPSISCALAINRTLKCFTLVRVSVQNPGDDGETLGLGSKYPPVLLPRQVCVLQALQHLRLAVRWFCLAIRR